MDAVQQVVHSGPDISSDLREENQFGRLTSSDQLYLVFAWVEMNTVITHADKLEEQLAYLTLLGCLVLVFELS